MIDPNKLIYLHGLESTSNSGKACLFREWFPGMLTLISLALSKNAWINFIRFLVIKKIGRSLDHPSVDSWGLSSPAIIQIKCGN